MSPRRWLIALLMVAAATGSVVVSVVAGAKPPTRPGPLRTGPELTVSPARGGRHARVVVRFTARRATGVFGDTRRSYIVEARAARLAGACVNGRDRVLPGRRAGTRVRATLDPGRGEGGPLGWCRGAFRGTVTYSEAYACPAHGRCRPPRGFPARRRLIARFSFRVR